MKVPELSAVATLGCAALFSLAASSAMAETTAPGISLELNKAEDTGGGCHLSFVMSNLTGTALPAAAYELVLFDDAGVISQMSVFDFGSLPDGKTVVRQFQLPGLPCTKAGRLLINGPAGCTEPASSGHCTASLTLSSRTGLDLTQ
ncbi:hypothetical protein WNZ15_09605 [Roseibium sp. AS2]|uniref:hypothetical protein n=1 Tax=Roseibium sp. AS2 TaxID=3135781 RepID=UPI0031761188